MQEQQNPIDDRLKNYLAALPWREVTDNRLIVSARSGKPFSGETIPEERYLVAIVDSGIPTSEAFHMCFLHNKGKLNGVTLSEDGKRVYMSEEDLRNMGIKPRIVKSAERSVG